MVDGVREQRDDTPHTMILNHDYPVLANILLGLLLFGGLVGMMLLGRRRGRKVMADLKEDLPGLGAIEGALFALFGLLIALTFSGAIDRFQDRKFLILREAQISSTAYSRLELLPEPVRKDLQRRFRSYLKARLDAYGRLTTLEALEDDLRRAAQEGAEIVRIAAVSCRSPESAGFAQVLLPPINGMLDIATARTVALRKHPPAVIYSFLIVISLICAFLAGFSMARGSVLSKTHVTGFALMIALTIWVTLDLEHPRFGLFSIGSADRLLHQTLEEMK